MRYWLGLVAVVLFVSSADAGPRRLTGRINSLAPSDGMLFIDDAGGERIAHLVVVEVRSAKVVRVWRDTANPAEWRERPTRLSRWPAGTFVVVIGVAEPSGLVRAHRIEIPKADDQ